MNASSSSSGTADAPCLQLQDLRVGFEGEAPLLRQWSACIGPGLTLLEGDTGSGKSTVLRVLAGEQPAAGGAMHLGGASLPGDAWAWQQQCFWVDPATQAFHEMGVRECVAQLRANDVGFDDARWQALVEAFGLAPHLDKGMHMLSTGSRRKVWLACALASGRPLTLLDEPTAALDAGSIRALHAALAALAQDARRIVIVASGEAWPTLPWRERVQLPML